MGPSEALCLLTQNNLQQLTNVSIKLFCQSVSIRTCVYSVFCDISLWIKERFCKSERFCSPAPNKSHALRCEACSVSGFFAEKHLFVMHMPYLFFHNILFRAFRLFDVLLLCLDWVNFWPKANTLSSWRSVHLVFHLAQNLFVCCAVKWMIFGKTACVIEMFAVFHILVNIVSLNLQQKIVHIGVDEFPLFAVPGFERVVIKSYIRILLFLRIDIPTYTGLSSLTLSLLMLTPTRFFVNCVHPVNKGLVINLQSFPFHHYELFFCLCVSACSPLFHQKPHCSWACRSFFENSLLRAFWILHFCTSSLSISYIGVGKLILA